MKLLQLHSGNYMKLLQVHSNNYTKLRHSNNDKIVKYQIVQSKNFAHPQNPTRGQECLQLREIH